MFFFAYWFLRCSSVLQLAIRSSRCGWFAFLLFLEASISFSFTAETATAIAQRALQALPPGHWTFSGVLSTQTEREDSPISKEVSPANAVQFGERLLTIQFQQGRDGTRQITYRAESKGRVVEGVRLIFAKDERSSLQLIDLATEIPTKDLRRSFLGSVFNMEDLSLHFLTWERQELLGDEILKDRVCWKIVSYPAKSETSSYKRVESWIDKQYQAILKAVAYDEKGNVIKKFNVRSFQQLEDVWILKELDLDAPLLKAQSRLEILEARRQE